LEYCSILNDETNDVVFDAGTLQIEGAGEVLFSEPWNGKDSAGNFLPQGRYVLEMWLIGQNPDYRARSEFFAY
jgi:flagellar hook assembly protein FlgD